jgi:hypothetical protein
LYCFHPKLPVPGHWRTDLDPAQEVEARATTLRSTVLKERVGSVRSQAASRYEVTPAELVTAAHFPHPDAKQGRIDEDAVAATLAKASGAPGVGDSLVGSHLTEDLLIGRTENAACFTYAHALRE